MNREVLFRGKCVSDSKYAGEWVTGGYVPLSEDITPRNEGLIMRFIGGNSTITYHVDPDTVGQFTGLMDKNGVKIFEGDIVRYNDTLDSDYVRYDEKQKVEFIDGCFYPVSEYWCQGIKVIGNIHDNSELLSIK